jgi:hypothetical protein
MFCVIPSIGPGASLGSSPTSRTERIADISSYVDVGTYRALAGDWKPEACHTCDKSKMGWPVLSAMICIAFIGEQ